MPSAGPGATPAEGTRGHPQRWQRAGAFAGTLAAVLLVLDLGTLLEVDWSWGTKDQSMCLAVEGPWSPTTLVALQASVALAKEALSACSGGNVASLSK